jgi:hypothetical protein
MQEEEAEARPKLHTVKLPDSLRLLRRQHRFVPPYLRAEPSRTSKVQVIASVLQITTSNNKSSEWVIVRSSSLGKRNGRKL